MIYNNHNVGQGNDIQHSQWRHSVENNDFLGNGDVCFFPSFFVKIASLKVLPLKVYVKVTNYNAQIQWQISMYIKVVLEHFSLALNFSRYSHFIIRDLENVGQGRNVQHAQWHHSMVNTRLHIRL